MPRWREPCSRYFFLIGTAPSEISTLSLHDALPIWIGLDERFERRGVEVFTARRLARFLDDPLILEASKPDRKSTRLNSSHVKISYAGFCLKKKKNLEILGSFSFCFSGV